MKPSIHRNRKFDSDNLCKLIKILRENNVDRTTAYQTFRSVNHNTFKDVILPSNPWQSCNMSAREFFSTLVAGESDIKKKAYNPYYKYKKIHRKNLEEHLQLARDNKLCTIHDFSNFIRRMGKPCEYYTFPWHVFKLHVTEFFKLAFGNYKEIMYDRRIRMCGTSDLEHVTICMENGLTNSRKYREFYLQHRGEKDMLSRPWDRYGMNEKQFFQAVRAHDMSAFVQEIEK